MKVELIIMIIKRFWKCELIIIIMRFWEFGLMIIIIIIIMRFLKVWINDDNNNNK